MLIWLIRKMVEYYNREKIVNQESKIELKIYTNTDLLLDLICRFEGFREKAYKGRDGIWTVGFGQTVGVNKNTTVSKDHAHKLLNKRVGVIVDQLCKMYDLLGMDPKVILNRNQFGVLISFIDNIGIGQYKRSSVHKYILSGDYSEAMRYLLMYVNVKGKKEEGLVKRRIIEKAIFEMNEEKYISFVDFGDLEGLLEHLGLEF